MPPEEPTIQITEGKTRIDLPLDPTANTKVYVDASLTGLRSEMRMWFITAIVGNQVLAHVQVANAARYIGGAILIGSALSFKVFFLWRAHSWH